MLGRKNWLFARSPEAAQRMAIIYSLVATCKINGINPEKIRDGGN
jgi:transposase